MSGLDPYTMEEGKIGELNLKKVTPNELLKNKLSDGLRGNLITGIILLIIGLVGLTIQYLKEKKTQTTQETNRQEGTKEGQIRYLA
jgi:hypothetical protein